LKKILLALATTLLFPNMSHAAACVTGTVDTAGCTIGTTDITYTLTGDIAPAPGVIGIQFNTGADRNNVTQSGNITTTGNVARGLYLSSSDNNTTTLTGDISTTGDAADGLNLSSSDSNTTTLTGDISTTGFNAIGLYLSSSDNNTTTLTGDISTTGKDAYGLVLSNSSNNTTTLNGDISTGNVGGTTGINAHGLLLSNSSNNTTTLTGGITTKGDNAFGLYLLNSNYNTTTLTGDISTTGDLARGLYLANSTNNTTTLTGDITTTANGAHGLLLSNSNNNTTTLTGDISTGNVDGTTGDDAYGLLLTSGNNNTTTLTGDISTTGSAAHGLFLTNSNNNTISLGGKVTASHGTAYSAYFHETSDNNILAFGRGSTFITNYYNDGTDNTLDFTNLGRAASYSYDWTVDGGGTDFLLTDANKPLVEGSAKSRGVADMDDAGNRLYQRLSQINSSLTNQQRQTRQGQARGDYWIDSYYTDSERDTVLQEVNQHTRGITVGFNASGDRDLAMDVVINYENSDADYGLSDQTVDANSLMVGLSFPALMTAMDGSLAVKFLAGMSDNDRDMTVVTTKPLASKQERITDSYDSTYVTAGASWMQSLYATQRFKSQFLLGMDINHEQIEGSTASAYYRLDDRDITQLVGQAQYGITIQGMNKQLQINGSIGLAHANIIDGENQSYTIDGTAVSYTADNSNTYTTASLGATYQLTPQAYAYAHVKQFDSTDDIDGTTGKVGLVVNF
jgi:hypothetical protein